MPVRSMTGFGRCSMEVNLKEISVDIKAVNHRYFDFSTRISRSLSFVEDKLKSLTMQSVKRGKIEMHVYVNFPEGEDIEISVNTQLAKSYLDALSKIENSFSLENNIKANDLARYPDVLNINKVEQDEEEITKEILLVAQKAIEQFNDMRVTEGKKLYEDCVLRLDNIFGIVEKIEVLSPQSIKEYKERLENKIKETLENTSIDESRILTEVAIFADKIAVDEETVRLKSHISQFKDVLQNANEPVGKKLDFIVQEMNREVNTIGSKCNNIEITKLVVEAKNEIEKIREQIQNIE